MSGKLDELLNTAKINELLHKKQVEEERKSSLFWLLAIIGGIATIAIIAYGVYKYFTPNYLDEFDDDFDDDFDDFDDFDDDFEDDLVEEEIKTETK